MKEIGVVLSIKKLGATEDMLPGIVQAVFHLKGGYKELDNDEILAILKESMK